MTAACRGSAARGFFTVLLTVAGSVLISRWAGLGFFVLERPRWVLAEGIVFGFLEGGLPWEGWPHFHQSGGKKPPVARKEQQRIFLRGSSLFGNGQH